MTSNTMRITAILRGDASRVCPTCNEFLTGAGVESFDYCESCRRATHVQCVQQVDGVTYCSTCASERRIEIELDAAMDKLKAFAEELRPRVANLAGLQAGGEFVDALKVALRLASDVCDRWEFPLCPNCGNYAAPVTFQYAGDHFEGCVDCSPRHRPEPAPPAEIEAVDMSVVAVEMSVPF